MCRAAASPRVVTGLSWFGVRLDPDSYDAYVKTGKFPVGAILQLEVRTPVEEIAPAKGGKTQGGVVGRSLHVKDEKGGPGTWTFYGQRSNGAPIISTRQ